MLAFMCKPGIQRSADFLVWAIANINGDEKGESQNPFAIASSFRRLTTKILATPQEVER